MAAQTEHHQHLRRWAVDAKAREETYLDEIQELTAHDGQLSPETKSALATAKLRLDEAAAAREPASGFWAWTGGLVAEYWTGSDREETWRAIHEADSVLTYARSAGHIRAELPGLSQTVRRRVDDELYREDLLERLKTIQKSLDKQAEKAPRKPKGQEEQGRRPDDGGIGPNSLPGALTISDADRTSVAHVKQEVYTLSSEGFKAQRDFRNIIFMLTLVATLAAAFFAVLGLYDDTLTYRLDLYPKTGRMMWPDTLWPVELIGAFAGFIVAMSAVRRLSGHGPYRREVLQAALKVPAGALTALAGMLLLQTGSFGIGPVTTKGQFVAWAFVFGASQELVTRLVDKRAAAVADKAKPGG